MKIDLHTHSNHSACGDQSVRELVDVARDCGIQVLSLTDHDTVGGVEEAVLYGSQVGVVVVPGIEISVSSGEDTPSFPNNSKLHILGYNIDPYSPLLPMAYQSLVPAKKHRVEELLSYLRVRGFDLNLDALEVYNELHVIRQMIAKGYCRDRTSAKKILRTPEIAARYPEVRFSLRQGLDLVRAIGGLPVLAHAYRGPGRSDYSDSQVRELVTVMKGYGLVGIETHHYFHLEGGRVEKLVRICLEEGLIPTIGSDHHSHRRTYLGVGDDFLRQRVLSYDGHDFSEILSALGIDWQPGVCRPGLLPESVRR